MRNLLKKIIAAAASLSIICAPNLALAQSSPNLRYGQVPTAEQWNSYFKAKQDTLGFAPLNKAGDAMLGRLVTSAPGTTAGFNLFPGSAPGTPADGDLWTTTTGLFARINGATVGPLGPSTGLANPTALIGLTAVNGSSPAGLRADGAPALDQSISPVWTGSHTFDNAITLPNGIVSGLANPSASIGLTAIDGSATTAMRSDGAPALDQSIAPTWTGIHTFSLAPVFTDQAGTRTALGLGTAATQNTGTSGTTIPLLNGQNAWSGAQTITSPTAPYAVDNYASGSNNAVSSLPIYLTDATTLSGTERHTVDIFADANATGDGGISSTTRGLVVSSLKNNWVTTTDPGQYIGITSIVRSGGPASCPGSTSFVGCGDGAGITINAFGSSPNSAMLAEEWVSGYAPGGSVVAAGAIQMHGHIGSVRSDQNLATGYLIDCINGSCVDGFRIRNTATGVTNPGTWTYPFRYTYDDGVNTPYDPWRITTQGWMRLSGLGAANCKFLRVGNVTANNLELLNCANDTVILDVDDTGNLYVGGAPNSTTPPTSANIYATAASGVSNTLGTPLNLRGGLSTGSAGSAAVNILGTLPGSSGSTQNSAVTVATISPTLTTLRNYVTNAEASATILPGQCVYVSGNNSVKLAKADVAGTANCAGLMSTSTAAGAKGGIVRNSDLSLTTAQWDAIAGTTGGLTPGAVYYLDPTTAGNLTATKPTAAGQFVQAIGVALNVSVMQVRATADPYSGMTITGSIINTGITTDATHTDSTVCQDTTSHQFYFGSGALGVCLGTSGRQFKTAFKPMKAGLAEIVQINLWNYRYRKGYGDNGAREQYGPTAQDIEHVLPDLVGRDKNGAIINYDWGALLPISIHAIQELKAENDNLKSRIDRLERRVSR